MFLLRHIANEFFFLRRILSSVGRSMGVYECMCVFARSLSPTSIHLFHSQTIRTRSLMLRYVSSYYRYVV